MKVFDPKYVDYTPNNKLNFIGAVHRYFEEININNRDDTKKTYIDYYDNNIFPWINSGKPIETYDIDSIEKLIRKVQYKNNYKNSTVNSTIRHLLYDPCKCFYEEFHPDKNPFDINPSDYGYYGGSREDQESALLSIVKSLTIEEEKRVYKNLLKDPKTIDGEYLGLAIMFFTACRNNEACGLNYGDILEMINYPGSYYIQITKSVEYRTNYLKSGGKTQNAFRRLPLISILKDFLDKRIDFLKSVINFPLEQGGKVYQDVYELPIACRDQRYGVRCNSDDLTIAGRNFLRKEVGIRKARIAGLQFSINNDADTEYDLGEKDVTTYLLRRNMATHLYTLGFSVLESQYYMGHKMEGTPLKRSDFGDETFLYNMWVKLQNHPLNKAYNEMVICNSFIKLSNETESDIVLKNETNSDFLLQIRNREPFDSVTLEINGNFKDMKLYETYESAEYDEIVNISSLIKEGYR